MSLYYDGRLLLSGCLILNQDDKLLLLRKRRSRQYETPGGKVEKKDSDLFSKVRLGDITDDLFSTMVENAAAREACEEVGGIVLAPLEYFGCVEFKIPGGPDALAYKFLTRIVEGSPYIREMDKFSGFDYFSLRKISKNKVSPSLTGLEQELEYLHTRICSQK